MRLGKKVQKVMRVGAKALAVAGAVGGAWLGVKNVQYHANQGARDEYHAGVEARDEANRKKDATAKSKAIMEKLDRDEEADKRHSRAWQPATGLLSATATGRPVIPSARKIDECYGGKHPVIPCHRDHKTKPSLHPSQRI